jgi:hypothetical protein
MAYVKPGVEIKQVQTNASPSLIAPDLIPVVIGKGFYIEEAGDYSYGSYSGLEEVITPSTLPSGAELHDDSVYVDIIGGTGADAGTRVHLVKDTDFTVSANNITINASLGTTYTEVTGLESNASIEIGFRAQRKDLGAFITLQSEDDIEEQIGKAYSYNPLALASIVAMQNTGTNVVASAITQDTQVPSSNEFSNGDINWNTLKVKEIYAMAPITSTSGLDTTFKSHVNTYSAPTEKKERMVIWNPSISWKDNAGDPTTKGVNDVDTAITAGVIKENSFTYGDRRFISVHPDVVYVSEIRHVSTLTTAYRNVVQGVADEPVYLGQAYSINVDGVTYSYAKGIELTPTILTNLAREETFILVEVPVPGYIASAAIAGMISGNSPEQPFTNLTVAGLTRVKYSSDTFTEGDLNTMAEGGTYILVQNSEAAPIYCRHQLTTDMTSVENRELSILKSLDYVAKFLRNGLNGYIGKYNISTNFLKLLNMTLQAQILYLVREGVVRDIRVVKVEQDEAQKDSVTIILDVDVKYPANYIRITLQY